ncbi:hypothetical protein BJ508DRAFT_321603 [Ascobolus immersus RN42]|uniref:Chaperone/heat shock protein Hsp12 n=1 Tax=Ascobolus immersus RN42 TaxID=1160509 RepID=A0A3N4IKR4_ASCIM|nr:hypothetical protein BJ508DRAFT_321603 [Ascobolus immersus RN42]
MSDLGRKDVSSQIHDAVKPDSQKTTTEHAGDKLSGVTDRVGAAVQPDSQKSATQKSTDSSKGVVDSVKDTVNNLVGNK